MMKKQKDILPMSKKERQRYHLLKLVIEGSITLKEASPLNEPIRAIGRQKNRRVSAKSINAERADFIFINEGTFLLNS